MSFVQDDHVVQQVPSAASNPTLRNLRAGAYGQASRICCTIQSALGFLVTLKPRICRRSWPMTKKEYRTPNVSVGTVKKSIAAIASRWFCRNVSQSLAVSGLLGARRSQRETVGSDTLKPSFSNSPWIRGAPHVGFSAAMRKISARSPRSPVSGLPVI
jgi:hypothetical protein